MGFTIPIYFLTASLNYPINDLFCENFFYAMMSKIFSNYSIFFSRLRTIQPETPRHISPLGIHIAA